MTVARPNEQEFFSLIRLLLLLLYLTNNFVVDLFPVPYLASFLPSFFPPSAERREEEGKEIKVLQGAHDEIIRIETSGGRFKGQHIKAYVMASRVKDDTSQLFLSFLANERMSKRSWTFRCFFVSF